MNNDTINGVINVYKEKGFTSHDVVAKLRGILKTKKIGHTGTLDPDAEGVLPICIGNATKLCDMIMEKTKVYKATLLLGVTTDTQDTTGNVICKKEVLSDLSKEEIEKTIHDFVGDIEQIPPMYSAIKVNGKKLYELARAGIEIERKARKIKIYSIEINNICLPEIEITVTCSKGTYIRTLCNDIGEKLGTGGCMASLLRMKTGPFELKDSVKLSDIEQLRDQGSLFNSGIIHKTDFILREYKEVTTKEKADSLLKNGNILVCDMFAEAPKEIRDTELFRVYNSNNTFCGVYEYNEKTKIFKSFKMFLS